jgi:hypothetical protein
MSTLSFIQESLGSNGNIAYDAETIQGTTYYSFVIQGISVKAGDIDLFKLSISDQRTMHFDEANIRFSNVLNGCHASVTSSFTPANDKSTILTFVRRLQTHLNSFKILNDIWILEENGYFFIWSKDRKVLAIRNTQSFEGHMLEEKVVFTLKNLLSSSPKQSLFELNRYIAKIEEAISNRN